MTSMKGPGDIITFPLLFRSMYFGTCKNSIIKLDLDHGTEEKRGSRILGRPHQRELRLTRPTCTRDINKMR